MFVVQPQSFGMLFEHGYVSGDRLLLRWLPMQHLYFRKSFTASTAAASFPGCRTGVIRIRRQTLLCRQTCQKSTPLRASRILPIFFSRPDQLHPLVYDVDVPSNRYSETMAEFQRGASGVEGQEVLPFLIRLSSLIFQRSVAGRPIPLGWDEIFRS